MVIISTSAIEVSIHAVSPLLILSTPTRTGWSGAAGAAAAGAAERVPRVQRRRAAAGAGAGSAGLSCA